MGASRDEAVRAAFDKHAGAFKSSRRRHPAEVTATRLGQAVMDYRHLISGAEADAFSMVIQILDEIAEGDR